MCYDNRPVEEHKLPRGMTLKIYHDDSPFNPLDDGPDGAGVAYCWHSRYRLGHHKHNKYETPTDLMDALLEEFEITEGQSKIAELEKKGFLIVPLYLYDHSGLVMSTGAFSCPWDSGQVGWWVVRPEEVQKEWSGDYDQARKYVEACVETYSQYLGGFCYQYTIVNVRGKVLRSMSGFIGMDHEKSGLLESVKEFTGETVAL